MKKFLLKTTPILAAALLITGTMLFAGCEKEKKTENDITNVKWHLTKFVDMENRTEEEPLSNSNNVYWLKLKPSAFEGKSYSNELMGTVSVDAVTKKITFSNVGGTEICEYFDGQRFINCLYHVHSYDRISENTLILYYDKKKYLQFEKVNEP